MEPAIDNMHVRLYLVDGDIGGIPSDLSWHPCIVLVSIAVCHPRIVIMILKRNVEVLLPVRRFHRGPLCPPTRQR